MEGRTPETVGQRPDRFWDLYSRFYDSIYRLMPYRELLWDTYQALELEDGMRVLDAGCGTGNLERFISEKDHPSVAIDALDFSPAMLARARAKCANLDWVSFSPGDLSAPLPFPDATFDRVVSINVLYTLPDRDATLRELLRVLKPDGRLVLTSPTPEFAWRPLVIDHFGRVRNIWGTGRRVRTVLASIGTLATSALGSFILNVAVIDRRENGGGYHSLDEAELEAFLAAHERDGLRDVSIGRAFARQNLFATAVKSGGALAN